MQLHPIAGGPLHGEIYLEGAMIYVRRNAGATMPHAREGEDDDCYRYTLIAHGEGHVYVPLENRDLIAAFRNAGSGSSDEVAVILSAELQRRKVDV